MKPNNRIVMQNVTDYTLYDEINMEDRLFVTWDMFERAVTHLYERISDVMNTRRFDGIYAIPRGGLVLGVKLSYKTGLPLIIDPLRITRDTLVVDDCTKSGKTLSRFADNIKVVMFNNPASTCKPDIYYKEVPEQINFCWESKGERN